MSDVVPRRGERGRPSGYRGQPRWRSARACCPAPAQGFGVTFAQMFRKVTTEQYPEVEAHRAALPRAARAQPVAGRAGEVRRVRAVRLGLPGRRDLRRGRRQHRGRAVLAG